MKRIKNWKLFTESVEDSLEEIKWVLVDYDIDDYEYYPNSTKLLSFLVNDKLAVRNEFKRIENQAAYEGWDVIYNGAEALIFYKDDLEDSIINWLDENYSNLKPETIVVNNKLHLYYMKNNMRVFTYEKDDDPIDIEVNGLLYELPLLCLKKDPNKADKIDTILKGWLNKTYNLDVRNIYYEEK
jgi:hypothetical protein